MFLGNLSTTTERKARKTTSKSKVGVFKIFINKLISFLKFRINLIQMA